MKDKVRAKTVNKAQKCGTGKVIAQHLQRDKTTVSQYQGS